MAKSKKNFEKPAFKKVELTDDELTYVTGGMEQQVPPPCTNNHECAGYCLHFDFGWDDNVPGDEK